MIKTVKAEPNASSMFNTMRSIGYTVETALADIIDNSISAGATFIDIIYEFESSDSYLAIIDNGNGMSNDELVDALRPGSRHPDDTRNLSDLGRFGLGLKTASLSQCKRLSVLSKQNGKLNGWTWDLDYIHQEQEWLLIDEVPLSDKWKGQLESYKNGTAVIWTNLDRLHQDLDSENPKHRASFFSQMSKCADHLSMVFHRFIEGNVPTKKKLIIMLNGLKIEAWDPFMTDIKAVEPRPLVKVSENVNVKGFVLPHRSKITPSEYRNAMKIHGSWTEHQGFYVYRSNRILVSGNWLGLFKNERQYDLCRIKIDISNDSDKEWKIDIKKSNADIPTIYKERLKTIAKDVRAKGVEVYRKKGKVLKRKLTKSKFEPMWNEVVKNEKYYFKINRSNSVIKSYVKGENNDLISLLKYIEESIPTSLIAATENNNELIIGRPFNDKASELLDGFKIIVNIKIREGLTKKQAINNALFIEPFDGFPELAEMIEND